MNRCSQIAEMQGIYGPYWLPESIFQAVWAQQDFTRDGLKTLSGQSLVILSPGRWNLLEGPDFRNARILLGGERREGDVELHLYLKSWMDHGHACDPRYAGVILHVLLFHPPTTLKPEKDLRPHGMETVCLLPYLREDMERLVERYQFLPGRLPGKTLPSAEALAWFTKQRWKSKCRTIEERAGKLSWEEACHLLVLSSLGARRNTQRFFDLALKYPLESWKGGFDEVLMDFVCLTEWKLKGVRPANHPRVRLHQYRALCQKCPDWPERIFTTCRNTVEHSGPADPVKDSQAWTGALFSRDLMARLWGDVFWPLFQREGLGIGFNRWVEGPPGTLPQPVREVHQLLREKGGAQYLNNGRAQGILGWLVAMNHMTTGPE